MESMMPEKVIVTLDAENALLRERVQDFDARLDKDRHNISKRPSSDGLTRQTPLEGAAPYVAAQI
jgi:hypothetical protein